MQDDFITAGRTRVGHRSLLVSPRDGVHIPKNARAVRPLIQAIDRRIVNLEVVKLL